MTEKYQKGGPRHKISRSRSLDSKIAKICEDLLEICEGAHDFAKEHRMFAKSSQSKGKKEKIKGDNLAKELSSKSHPLYLPP